MELAGAHARTDAMTLQEFAEAAEKLGARLTTIALQPPIAAIVGMAGHPGRLAIDREDFARWMDAVAAAQRVDSPADTDAVFDSIDTAHEGWINTDQILRVATDPERPEIGHTLLGRSVLAISLGE